MSRFYFSTMKKSWSVLLFLLTAVFAPVLSQKAAGGETAPDPGTEKSLLWRIGGKDLDKPSFLFGTIHLITKEAYFFSEAMQSAFDETQRVTFEIDMDEMTDFSNIFAMMSGMYMKNGTTLRDLLTPEEYQVVADHFRKIGLPLSFLERIKPMFLSMMAGEDLMSFKPGSDSTAMTSYELELMDKARKQDKDIAGLETMEFQMSLFDSIPYEAQAKMLLGSIQAGEQGDDQLEQMIRLYLDQDIQGMQQIMDDDPEGLGDYEELLLQKRNRSWIPVMEKMMAEGPTFFAVGAGHLGGEQGVINLLRQAGYTLTPVK